MYLLAFSRGKTLEGRKTEKKKRKTIKKEKYQMKEVKCTNYM